MAGLDLRTASTALPTCPSGNVHVAGRRVWGAVARPGLLPGGALRVQWPSGHAQLAKRSECGAALAVTLRTGPMGTSSRSCDRAGQQKQSCTYRGQYLFYRTPEKKVPTITGSGGREESTSNDFFGFVESGKQRLERDCAVGLEFGPLLFTLGASVPGTSFSQVGVRA